ncbi:MAG: GNAT family N-acetyltransferase [Actinomycetota bacterium]
MTVTPPAGIDIRPATPDEMHAMLAAAERAFGEDLSAEMATLESATLEADRTLAAFDGTTIVASSGIYSFEMTVPGGPTPVAGVTWVGVLPTHRRRGILTTFMRRQLTELYDAGREPVAALWASEAGIYSRFGYGLASRRMRMTVPSRLPYIPGSPAPQQVRMIPADEVRSACQPVYEQLRVSRPGFVSRSPARWDVLLHDPEHDRQGASSLTAVALESGSGYVLYRTKTDFGSDGIPNGKATPREIMATDAAGYAALWRYLLDLDLMGTIEAWNRPVDDPLQYLVADIRRLHGTVSDNLWVRIVDVDRALSARTYSTADSLVIELLDGGCPWNAGRFRIDVGTPDSPDVTVQRTDESADLTMSAVQLGAVYLGGTRLRDLAAAGLVDEHSAGSVLRADRLFAGAVEPWCPEVF